MPGINITVGGDAKSFVTTMQTVEMVAVKSGSATAASLNKAEAALVSMTNSTSLTAQETHLYEAALQKVRAELNLVAAAEINAKNAAAERARQAIIQSKMPDESARYRSLENADNTGVRGYNIQNTGQTGLDLNTRTMMKRDDDTWKANLAAKKQALKEAAGLEEQAAARSEYVQARMANMQRYQNIRLNKEAAEAAANAERLSARQQVLNTAKGGVGGFGRARGFGGASSAMFISVARDSAASLASGANPLTVFMQQAPQVAQAFTMMGSKVPFFGKLLAKAALDSEKLAASLTKKAVAAAGSAAADIFAADAELALSGATSVSTIAAKKKAQASTDAALADQARAVSAGEVAAVERAAAGSSMKALLPLAGMFAAIALAAVAAGIVVWATVKGMKDALAQKFEMPVPNDSYIEKHARKGNIIAEAWKNIRNAVASATEAYNTAANAAKKVEDATKSQFDAQRNILSIQKQVAMLKATTPRQKIEVEKQFDAKENEINKAERAKVIANLNAESKDSMDSANEKTKKGAAMLRAVGSTKEEDQDLQQKLDARAEAGKTFLEKDPSKWDEYKKQLAVNLSLGGDAKGKQAAVDYADQMDTERAQAAVEKAKTNREENHKKEESRKPAQALIESGIADAANAVKAKFSADTKTDEASRADADYAAVDAERQKLYAQQQLSSGGNSKQSLTSREQIGAYSGGGQTVRLIDLSRKQHAELGKHTRALADILAELREGAL